jgi:hypothetical protein
MLTLKKLLLETPEANPDDIFGEYLFGDSRIDEPAKFELDTKKEFEFKNSLKDHYIGNVYNYSLKSFMPTIFELINSGKYLDFLIPDKKYKHAYRLLLNVPLDNDDEEKLFGIDFLEIKNDKPFGLINKEIIYKPLSFHDNMSSWTLNLNKKIFEGLGFSFKKKRIDHYGKNRIFIYILLNAKIKNNKFILNPEEIDKKTKNVMPVNEWEVLSYGDVTVDKFSYFIADHENASGFGTTIDKITIYENDDILNKLIELIK